MTLGLVGILVSLVLLITLAYRGVTIVVAAPISALVAMVFSGAPILANYTEIFMPALANFIGQYFPMFLTGAIFGKLMTMAGYATDIARVVTRWLGPNRALLATVLTTALLTYGGISVFVVVFVMFPLARELFRAADIPRRLIPGAIAHGMLTFTMTALPGSPQVQNIIPGQAFQTNTFAAPGVGILGGTVIFILGMLWLEHRKRQLAARGEHFTDPTALELRNGAGADMGAGAAEMSVGDGSSPGSSAGQTRTSHGPGAAVAHTTDSTSPAPTGTPGMLTPPNHVFPFIPVLLVFALNFGCTMLLFPAMDWGHLQEDKYGGIGLDDRTGSWAVLCALAGAIVVILLMNVRHLRWILRGITDGARNALLPIFNTASEVGYGAVVASLAAFMVIRDGIFGVSENALVASALSTSTISGVTGSASGGMTIALNALGEELRDLAVDQGISLEAMHRITAMASGGLDSMPHNGAVITLIIVCGMTHRESYKDVGVVSLVIPVLVTAALIPVVLAVGSF
ncbi:GntP family permease [Nesterenkonia sp. HG001]|uniref:GntP family permease n=1 Tax=Nesterenkonia sp. HG001 TaxID=2983207 RepID=UPI002AC5CA57|nr:GntP family permease [Nesterenkonia sp. HG001]MDZ5077478.1 GntP family permease [Nesterenkonia sp. HG001]